MYLSGAVTWALQSHNLPKLRELLEQDLSQARLRAGDGSYTVLHKCANCDEPEILPILDMLIAAGADVNARDYTFCGVTPLHMACSEKGNLPRNVAVAERLLAAGADPDAQTVTQEDIARYQKTRRLAYTGLTPLHFALRQGTSDLIALLLRYKASPVIFTPEQNYGSPVDSARRAYWRRHLPEFLKVPIDFPRRISLKLKTVSGEPPVAFRCEYRFLDPQLEHPGDTIKDHNERLVAIPFQQLGEVLAPGPEETRMLSAGMDVPLGADGLPCNFEMNIRAAGDAQRMAYGFYAGKPIKYGDMFTSVQAAVVNLGKGCENEFQTFMSRNAGDSRLDAYCFRIIIVGE